MMTKKMNYICPAIKMISLDSDEAILNGSMGGENNDNIRPDASGVGASSWTDGNDDWFATRKYEGGIWK